MQAMPILVGHQDQLDYISGPQKSGLEPEL